MWDIYYVTILIFGSWYRFDVFLSPLSGSLAALLRLDRLTKQGNHPSNKWDAIPLRSMLRTPFDNILWELSLLGSFDFVAGLLREPATSLRMTG